PSSSSTVIPVQTPVLPFADQELFSQAQPPGPPLRAMVLNGQRSLPLRTSYARARPLVLLCVLTVIPSLNDEPTRITSFTTVGVEWRPASPVSKSICRSAPLVMPTLRSTMPALRKG